MTVEAMKAASASEDVLLNKGFDDSLKATGQFPLTSSGISVLQVNMGKLCNQSCRHCHVDAGPERTEVMSRQTMELCLEVLKREKYPTVDITGGAPEMNPLYRWFVKSCVGLGCHVKTRTNLTILLEEGYEDLSIEKESFEEEKEEEETSAEEEVDEAEDESRGDFSYEEEPVESEFEEEEEANSGDDDDFPPFKKKKSK